jgi:hypothetical protein
MNIPVRPPAGPAIAHKHFYCLNRTPRRCDVEFDICSIKGKPLIHHGFPKGPAISEFPFALQHKNKLLAKFENRITL